MKKKNVDGNKSSIHLGIKDKKLMHTHNALMKGG